MGMTQGLSSITFAIQYLSSIWDTFQNDDLSFWEKFLQITMSVSMALPMFISGLNALKNAHLGNALATGIDTLATWLNTAATEANTKENVKNTLSEYGLKII